MIVDNQGIPVIGANVVEKGTANGTITDIDGKFTLEVSGNATLQVSYIGYNTQELSVSGKTDFSVKLGEDTQALDEVVVVGYGTQKKVNLTGAVGSVRPLADLWRTLSLVPVILAFPSFCIIFPSADDGRISIKRILFLITFQTVYSKFLS